MKQTARYLQALSSSLIGKILDLGSLYHLSERAELCPLQDPYRIRARYLGWKTAALLIDDAGELQREVLQQLSSALSAEPYLLIMGHDGDERVYHHLLACLSALIQDEAIWKMIKKCSVPICNKTAEDIVRDTLWPDLFKTIQTPQVRRAVLSAWLTPLRQATGSCFATAPAILVQQHSPRLLIEDLDAILSAGQLRRGAYSVPMNPGSGIGEWRKNSTGLNVAFSPGLQVAFHAAGLNEVHSIEGQSVEQIISLALLKHYGLSEEDLIKEKSSPAPPAGVMWERGARAPGMLPSKTKQIGDWEKALNAARRSFCALSDSALLRCWEYTIASFSDVKAEFGRWNLFTSLGLHPDLPAGIGKFLVERIQGKMDRINQEMAQIHAEHQQTIHNIRATESVLQQSANENRRHQLQGEMRTAMIAADHLGRMLDETAAVGQWLSQLFPSFIQFAIEQLQIAFQEVFDPAIAMSESMQFEDSPAGFRLMYKHGRSAAASWERIENEKQFIDVVYRFFESIEREFVVEQSMKDRFTELVTDLMQFIRSDRFLEGAMLRSKENHAKRGLPWAYESGGTMQTLVQTYFQLPSYPQEFSREIRTEAELLAFLKDGTKILQGQGPWLMHSPTHAFLFDPPWRTSDRIVPAPARVFREMTLTDEKADYLAERFSMRLSEEKRPLFQFGYRERSPSQRLADVRNGFLSGIQTIKEKREEIVDGFFYESLPLFSREEARVAFERLKEALQISRVPFEEPSGPFLTFNELKEMMKQGLLSSGMGPFSSIDWEMKMADQARKLGLIDPHPVLFGLIHLDSV